MTGLCPANSAPFLSARFPQFLQLSATKLSRLQRSPSHGLARADGAPGTVVSKTAFLGRVTPVKSDQPHPPGSQNTDLSPSVQLNCPTGKTALEARQTPRKPAALAYLTTVLQWPRQCRIVSVRHSVTPGAPESEQAESAQTTPQQRLRTVQDSPRDQIRGRRGRLQRTNIPVTSPAQQQPTTASDPPGDRIEPFSIQYNRNVTSAKPAVTSAGVRPAKQRGKPAICEWRGGAYNSPAKRCPFSCKQRMISQRLDCSQDRTEFSQLALAGLRTR